MHEVLNIFNLTLQPSCQAERKLNKRERKLVKLRYMAKQASEWPSTCMDEGTEASFGF